MKRLNIPIVWFTFLLVSIAAWGKEPEEWENLRPDTLEQRLVRMQQTNSPHIEELTRFMIEHYPDRRVPYGIAATFYTLKGNHRTAEKTLLQAIENVEPNDDFYVKLAHFYKRVEPDKLEPFITDFKKRRTDREDYHLLLARLLIVAGRDADADRELIHAVAVPATFNEALELRIKLLKQLGREEDAVTLLLDAATSRSIPIRVRAEYFRKILESPEAREVSVARITRILPDIIAGFDTYPEARKTMGDFLALFTEQGMLIDIEQAFLQKTSSKEMPDRLLWMASLIEQYSGRKGSASSLLESYSGDDLILLEEKARLLAEDSSRTTDTLATWQRIVDRDPRNQRHRLSLAQFLNRSDSWKESTKVLTAVNPDQLESEAFVLLYYALSFDNAAHLRDNERIVTLWEEAQKKFDYPRLKVFLRGIFDVIIQTDEQRKLLAVVESRSGKHQKRNLMLLKIGIAEQVRDFDLYFSTAADYLSSLPDFDPELVYEYVIEAMRRGVARVTVGEEVKMVPLREDWLDFAEEWPYRLIRHQPFVPDYYIMLLRLGEVREQSEDALDLVRNLAHPSETDAEKVHLAAYVLARAGRPHEALPFYQRAIEMEPAMARYRVNYAGCLVRAGRFEDALKIYESLLLSQGTAESWNPAFLIGQIWYCATQIKKPERFDNALQKVVSARSLDMADLFITAAGVLSSSGMHNDALLLLERFLTNEPDNPRRYDAHFTAGKILLETGGFDKARKHFEEALAISSNDTTRIVDARFNIGEVERQRGNYEETVRLWTKLAEDFPDDELARDALVKAALIEENQRGRPEKALILYRKYLSGNPTNPDYIRLARSKINTLSIPTDTCKNDS